MNVTTRRNHMKKPNPAKKAFDKNWGKPMRPKVKDKYLNINAYLGKQLTKSRDTLIRNLQSTGYTMREAKEIANRVFTGEGHERAILAVKALPVNQRTDYLDTYADRLRRFALADLSGSKGEYYLSEKQARNWQKKLAEKGFEFDIATLLTKPEELEKLLDGLFEMERRNGYVGSRRSWISEYFFGNSN